MSRTRYLTDLEANVMRCLEAGVPAYRARYARVALRVASPAPARAVRVRSLPA